MAPQTTEEAARIALRERQGPGARYDSPDAPIAELEWARRGTAYFARTLAGLPDTELSAPSALPGWSRAHLVAHVGYNARGLSRLVSWARTGIETPMYRSADQRAREIERGSTLPRRALRSLFRHSERHLNVEWRDLGTGQWNVPVTTAQGRTVPVRETAWMRSREVWVHAVDLAPETASFRDFPPELLDELVTDVARAWARRGEAVDLTLHPTDRPEPLVLGAGGLVVTGEQADLARWLTGRGVRRLSAQAGIETGANAATLPVIPHWF